MACAHGDGGGGTMCVRCAADTLAQSVRDERARTLADVVAWIRDDQSGSPGPWWEIATAIERGGFARWCETSRKE